MSENKVMDLTQGSIPKLLLRFSLPFLLSNLMQQVYSMVDMMIVGNFVGSAGLSGVSNASTVTSLFTTVGTGLAMGGQIIMAQYQGAGNKDAQKETVGTMFSAMGIIALLISFVCILVGKPLLNLLNTPAEAFDSAWAYLVFCAAGTIFIFGYNAVCAILRGLGDSTRPMIFVAIASGVNIVLDLIFVGAFHWGAGGAAATAISQGVSFACALWFLIKRSPGFVFDFKLKSFRIVGERLKMIIKVGLPLALQFSVLFISVMFVMSIVNRYGVAASAAYGVGGKIHNFATIPVYAISSAAATMVGQNIGAGNVKRAGSTSQWCVVMLLAVEGLFIAVIQLFPSQLISIFDSDPEVVEIGVKYLRICSLTLVAHCFLDGYTSIANGVGFSLLALVSVAFDGVFLRMTLSYLLAIVAGMGITGVFVGSTIAPFGAALICIIYFYSGKWKTRSLVK